MKKPLFKNAHTGSDFNWDHLRVFLAVARTGRLTAAAARLKTDHATISRKIARLESELKTTLFDRSPRGYAITAQGEKLLAMAESMERLAIGAAEEIGGVDAALSGKVRIGAPEGFGSYFLAPRLQGLIDQYNDLKVELVASPNLVSLSKREADLAIVLSRPSGGRLFARKLVDFELCLFASDKYLKTHAPITSEEDLTNHRFIGYIDDLLYAPELDYIQNVHPHIETNFGSNNLVAQLGATLVGSGLCILPTFIAHLYEGLTPILPDRIRLAREFWLVTHADMRERSRVKAASQFITDEVHKATNVFTLPKAA